MSNSNIPKDRAFVKLLRRLSIFTSEPLPFAIYMTYEWVISRLRSTLYSHFLNAPDLNIGSGCSIKGMRCINMGRGVSIYKGLWLEAVRHYREQSFSPLILIGDRVSFSKDVHISCTNRIEIGNGVLFGSHVYVSDHNHGRYVGECQSSPDEPPSDRELTLSGTVIIEDNVWIGDNVVILGPVRIGTGCIVAANAVVKGDVPSGVMIAGAPAKPIKRFDSELKIWKKI